MTTMTVNIENLKFLEDCSDLECVAALAESIKKDGLMHEIVVARSAEEGMYTIISGARRTKGCKELGMREILCKVIVVETGCELKIRKKLNLGEILL